MTIEWDVVATARARLLVDVAPRDEGYGEWYTRPATLEDLKQACKAVGLHVVEHSFATTVAKAKAIEAPVFDMAVMLGLTTACAALRAKRGGK